MLTTDQVRNKFLKYFELKGHKLIKSSSLIPFEDKSLLFVNAGMVQFKNIFLGLEKKKYNCATSSQKCIRISGKHNDFESVGKTSRHHTFFEMLGNFSFGSYFKEKAILLAWKFLTKELKIPKKKLWVSVYEKDKNTYEIWNKITDINKDHILFLNSENNFWTMGENGPCGPCTEIYYDYGKQFSCGNKCKIGKCNCDRFLEIWNLVFMEFNRLNDKKLINLKIPSVDTGMGLERIVSVVQNVKSNYDIDSFQLIIKKIEELTNFKYKYENDKYKFQFRVIADHIRAAVILIGDGIIPSNEGRGYVLRKILRRAIRIGKTIELNEFFLYKIVDIVINIMSNFYIDLKTKNELIKKTIYLEEERFSKTLESGLSIVENILLKMKKENRKIMSGEESFMLYDTYGFPLELTEDILKEKKLTIDKKSFKELMLKQKKLSKDKNDFQKQITFMNKLDNIYETKFFGYKKYNLNTKILALFDMNGNLVEKLKANCEGIIITEKTSFYGESGGQVGDKGNAFIKKQKILSILDTKKTKEGKIYHIVKTNKNICLGFDIFLKINKKRRENISRNHSAIHLLNYSLRKILGNHIFQKGSYVDENYLRFDFSHFKSLSFDEIRKIENLINDCIFSSYEITNNIMKLKKAKEIGAIALFDEKYKEKVRVVKIDNISLELCGGTHVDNTSKIGFFKITTENSIGSGLRRIEAITGKNVLQYIENKEYIIRELKNILNSSEKEILKKTIFLINNIKDQKNLILKISKELVLKENNISENDFEIINGINVVIKKVYNKNINELNILSDFYKNKLKSCFITLFSEDKDKINLLINSTKDLVEFDCNYIVKKISKIIEGNGGGKKFRAQGFGKNKDKIKKAFNEIRTLIKKNGGEKK